MSKHTPGPWRFIENTASTHEVPCIEVNGNGTHQLAYLQAFPDYRLPAEECFANARLIAAAPDLLAAARFVMAFYEPGQTYLDTEAWKRAEASMRAAIAKATGEPA